MGLLASSMRRTAVQQLPRLTANLQVPSLWIAGSRDSIMPPGYVRHLAGYAPRPEIAVLAGAGHLPMGDRPDRLAEVMRPWLADPQVVESANGYVHWTSRRTAVGSPSGVVGVAHGEIGAAVQDVVGPVD